MRTLLIAIAVFAVTSPAVSLEATPANTLCRDWRDAAELAQTFRKEGREAFQALANLRIEQQRCEIESPSASSFARAAADTK